MEELHLRKKDFRVEWVSGTGGGGQYRNRHMNTCRITHLATWLCATCGDQRERPKNQIAAFKVLADRILEYYRVHDETKPQTNTSVIRTYHGVDNRVKDHASGFQQPYDIVTNDISGMIAARSKHMLLIMTQEEQ